MFVFCFVFLSEALQQLNEGLEPRECEFYLEKPKVPVHYRIYTSGPVQLQVYQDIIIIAGKHPLRIFVGRLSSFPHVVRMILVFLFFQHNSQCLGWLGKCLQQMVKALLPQNQTCQTDPVDKQYNSAALERSRSTSWTSWCLFF